MAKLFSNCIDCISAFYAGNQPNIHPGCISSTGRNARTSSITPSAAGVASSISGLSSVSLGGLNLVGSVSNSNILMGATSTQNAAAQQLIGGAISPSLFVTASQHGEQQQQQQQQHQQIHIPINHHVHNLHLQQVPHPNQMQQV